MSKKDLLGGDSQDRTQMMERSFYCPLFYCFHLIFSSLLEVAFLISLSSVPCLMETQGCCFFFLIVESDLVLHSWKFRERKERRLRSRREWHLTSSVPMGSMHLVEGMY